MAEGARVYSIDAIKIFRAALIKFAETGNVAMTSGDGDIDRLLGWLERDQTSYWEGQVRKRHIVVLQWEDAVRQKRIFKSVDGSSQSAVDEMKKLQQAKRAEEEAVQKVALVKKAIGVMRKESMMYKGRVQRLATALQSDIPRAIRTIDNMLEHLDSYLAVQTAGEGINLGGSVDEISRAAGGEKVGLEKLRERTPTAEKRQSAIYTAVNPDHPIHQPWGIAVIQDWQLKALGTLSIERAVPDPDHRIVFLPDAWQQKKIYLERREPVTDGDSGWYVGSAQDPAPPVAEDIAYVAFRIGDVIAARADLSDLLALPVGSLIVLDAGGPTAIFDQLGLDIWSLALIKAAEPPPAADTPNQAPVESAQSN